MTEIGYTLSSEEHRARDLVHQAARAEEVGFSFALISDHYHPWTDRQGQSPFVWSVIGGVAQATERLRLGTGVTCPIMRVHPAIIAQAAATAEDMMPGRFFLGVGTGENLNEHIVGERWPSPPERLEMLEEAVGVIRELWKGELASHRGPHFTVDRARLYSMPDSPPPIYVAGAGKRATRLAGEIGDGYIGTAPERESVELFEASGGSGKPKYGQIHVCWAETEEEARKIALRRWPNTAVAGGVDLPLPKDFEAAAELVREDDVTEKVVCGPDPERHIGAIRDYVDAGYDHVYVHQVGPDQDGFFRFYQEQVLPKVG